MRDEKGYKHCKYLDDLGIPVTRYGGNYTDNTDSRWGFWENQRKQYGFDERETWSLDWALTEWIYTRFKMYKEFAGDIVDLNWHKFDYEGKQITQGEAINTIIKACEKVLKSDGVWDDDGTLPKNIYVLLGEIMPAMWW